ncbi:MAG: SsrA-binding protein SmpB [Chitinophagaceae bacterium]|jgi:SsrA-binding protein|nr:MAG: SsrA-binding protein SmpB [Chitinophagaceae bacterium]
MSEIKNRSAFHDFFIDATYDAGIVLSGTEVKSIRGGKVSFNDSYCQVHQGEIWVKSLHIAEYSHGNLNNHESVQDRKLLLHKKEIRKIEGKLKEKGYTLVPLKIYFTDKNLVKMEIGLAKGKKLHDKRDTIRKKDVEREIKRFLK